jgi:hypothetical protein
MVQFRTRKVKSLGKNIAGFLGMAGRGDMGEVTSPNNFLSFRDGSKKGDVERVNGQGPDRPFQAKFTLDKWAENERI